MLIYVYLGMFNERSRSIKYQHQRLTASFRRIYFVYTSIMATKIRKWGNSLAVRIPKSALEQANLKEGSQITIIPSDKDISIRPFKNKKQSLKELVDGITDENRHDEFSFGKPIGREVW
jgi:antitoxin MazE